MSRRVIPRGMDYSMDAPVDRPAVTASPVTELPNSQRPARPTAGNNIRLLGRRIVGTSQLSPLGIGTSTIPDHQDASDRRLPAGFDYRTALTPPASVPQQPGPMAFPPNTDFVRYLRQRALRANDHETSESEEFSLGA